MLPIDKSDFDVDNFMRVSASLVRKLGSANDALVLARIVFRCALATSLTHQHDGYVWWCATKEDLSEETGLTVAQVKHSINRLIELGVVVAEEHRLGGSGDRTKSYRPAVPHEEMSKAPNSHPSPLERSPVAALTTYQDDKKKGYTAPASVSSNATAPVGLARFNQAFEKAWSYWPKKVDRKDSERRFREAARKVPLDDLVEFIRVHGEAYAAYREKVFTPGLATWLHRERWTDELVGPEPARNGGAPRGMTPTEKARDIVERGMSLDEARETMTNVIQELEELKL